ncbi:MAG: PDGLE domain-containing protein [Synechocystis sp.]|nr:PDGLE domain-containing protein [Synechocystis sp.]
MSKPPRPQSFSLLMVGLGVSLFVGVILSSFASSHPDGLERVAEDLKFDRQAKTMWTLPGSQWLADYQLKFAPERLATPLAGGIGTLITFGIMWGIGQGLKRRATESTDFD